MLLGAWLGLSRRAEALVYPSFVALAQIPTLAWIPLFMLFFGIGETLKLVVLVKAVVVPVTLHTLVGVRDAQPRLREAAAVLRLPPHLLAWRLVLPAALPAFMAGLRLALATGWTSLLAVELLASSEGIGYLMVWGRQLFMLDLVFVCILVIGLVGALMDRGINRLDSLLLFWPHPATAERPRGPRLHGWQRLQAALLPLALLALWQASSALAWVDANILASPLDVLRALHQGLLDGSLPKALGASLERTVAGLALGGGTGWRSACCWGSRTAPSASPGPAFRPCARWRSSPGCRCSRPGSASAGGLRRPGRLLPLFIATQRGVAGLSPQLGEAARVMRLGLGKRLRLLVLPGAAPAIFAGLRLALIYAWLGTIGAEYFMPSDGGIASYMLGAQQLFRMDQVMAAMVLVAWSAPCWAPSDNASKRATRWRTA